MMMFERCYGGPLTTLEALADSMDTLPTSKQDVRDHVTKALSDVGAPDDFCNFFASALQLEHDLHGTVYRLLLALKTYDGRPLDPVTAFKTIQELTRHFNQWQRGLEQLSEAAGKVKPLQLDAAKLHDSRALKALCSYSSQQMNLKTGDELVITDTSQPNKLKVRTSAGLEGYVPALSCLLPCPDRTAQTAIQRLQVQLLAAWTESVKTVQEQLMLCLSSTARALTHEWRTQFIHGNTVARERVGRRFKRIQDAVSKQQGSTDLTKLHNALYSLEKELLSWKSNGTDASKMTETVSSLDKAVLCYQMLHKQWTLHRTALEKADRPIRVMEQWTALKPASGNYKYYEYKMTRENVETKEEITYIRRPASRGTSEEWTESCSSANETVETEQITSSQAEEQRRFVIRAVVDPRNQQEISIADAIEKGIVDQSTGMYVNPETGDRMPIPVAMNQDLIKVMFQSAQRTKEETSAIGLITMKTRIDNRAYSIDYVLDASTGEKVGVEEAKERGILDAECESYIKLPSRDTMPLDAAIQSGWVCVEYEEDDREPEYETKTYAVNAVVDQREKKKINFYEAVKKGLIDRRTGNYINNVTGERIYVGEAIRRGFLKAKVVEDADGLNIDAENKMVVERMDMMRKNVLKRIGVVSALKRAAGLTNNNNNPVGLKNGV